MMRKLSASLMKNKIINTNRK